jgi:Uncharacterized conserved protein
METTLFSGGVWFSAFLAGVIGGPHCMMMCGGFVAALSSVNSPVAVVSQNDRRASSKNRNAWLLLVTHLGRIISYVLVGTLLGLLGQWAFGYLLEMQRVMATLAAVVLIALAIMIARGSSGWVFLERAGLKLYQKIMPRFAAHTQNQNGVLSRFVLGLLWGMTPCGLVYGIFPLALLAGGAWQGALVMLAFGLGTLPNLLLAGLALQHFGQWLRRRAVRYTAAAVIAGFALWGLNKLWFTDKMVRHENAITISVEQPREAAKAHSMPNH